MNLKMNSALVGFTLAFGMVTGVSVVFPTRALAEDCTRDYREGTKQQDACLLRKAKQMHQDRRSEDAECARGGCGAKSNAIQRKMNRNTNTFESNQD